MIRFINLVDDEIKLEENLEKICQKRCDSHNKYKATHFCTNFSCVKNSTSFLCELCYNNHSKNHLKHKEIKGVEDLFSLKRMSQIKEDCKIDPVHQEKINQISQELDKIFGKLKETFSNMIDQECTKAKANIQQKFSIENEYIMKIIKEHEQMFRDIFTKNEIMNNFQLAINPYLDSFNEISEAFLMQIEMVENSNKNMDLFLKNFSKINQKHKDIVDIVQQNISNFDELYDNLKLKDPIQSAKMNNILVEKIKKVEINKIPRLHTNTINKIINYENNTKYITCSIDKTIMIRNCEDNKISKTLKDHKESVRDILLLSNGKLASSSQDKTIKIWNIAHGTCEQTLIGHSRTIYCLLELPNSILLSGSFDSSIGIWDISQKNHKELQFYHQVKNDQQSHAYCMTLISVNELAVSSYKNINIYSFDNVTNNSFFIIKKLKGHTDWVKDIKLMNKNNDLLVSCSGDKDVRLWGISQENCLKIFTGHSDTIWSILILSEKIFVSAGKELIFWDIDSNEVIHSIKLDQSETTICSLIKNGSNDLLFAGGHDFIGLIKI